ncbi:effector-binding domain-containing protein [Streptomyces sp. WMMB 714]|jgi:effector-binding domain-containing protein|uniref:GyrI-like domain-containing protein n=1 Tax=Streptomyces sp. WMMB 714 TaxID=1286822 RepID=UPI0005F7EA07|nr:GyrI-like domain-containing protein [Streptomyces sp. WMMB 714]SCK55388.1 effector-binding domain-containing protein [Streptomyces sp. WMMB 714]
MTGSTPGSGPASGAPTPELVTVGPAVTAVVRGVVPMAGLRDFFDGSFRELAAVVSKQQLAVQGPAFALYHGVPGGTADLEVGFATDRPVTPEGQVAPGTLPAARVARVVHCGSFDALGNSWGRLGAWIGEQGLTPGEDMWECYLTEPSPDMDPDDLRTELNWPVRD